EDVKEIMELHVIDRNFLIVSIHHEWYGEKLYNIYLLYYDKELQIITKYLEIAFGHIQDDEKYNTIMDSVPGTHFGREFLSIIDFNGDGIDDIISFYIYDRSDNYFFAIYSLGETVAFIENQVAFGVKDNYEMPPVVFHQENGRMHYEVLFPPGPDYSR
ncbi:MAG: hypothetical protein LBK13_02710, partial [Spirochaetales bacterium]|nr:hypothetical protein [Spirochaetales bacterium]